MGGRRPTSSRLYSALATSLEGHIRGGAIYKRGISKKSQGSASPRKRVVAFEGEQQSSQALKLIARGGEVSCFGF